MIEAGQSVDGYRVERLIGRGGMGVVYEAVQTSMKRRVALKVLRPELADDPAFVERFRREARLQASLEHPNVLEVYDVGESDEGLFLAMRLVSGETLLDLLRDGELDATRALGLLDQVSGALDVAHDASLIHRDVKPQNVLVGEGDRAFLADFGITRASSDTTVASTSTVLGSVAYVAPEIVRGEEPTPASDRYSIAATLFHCLTGDVVFPRGSDAAVLYAHATEAPPHVHDRREELPRQLDAVMEAALAKQPEARPATAREIVGAARDALGPTVQTLGSPRVALATEPAPAAIPAPVPRRRSIPRMALWGAALLAAAAVGVGVAVLLDDGGGEGTAEAEVPVPAVAPGAQALGGDLALPDRSLDCRGKELTPASPSCAIAQSALPGATLLVPADGMIVGWAVRGASGELALDVIRPRGTDTHRIAKSQWESVGNQASYYFKTALPVEAGDQLAVELGPGAAIGATAADGATTQRWKAPAGGNYGEPDLAEGTGFDYELALRTDFLPGAKAKAPPRLTGAAAARAPDGNVRARQFLKVDQPQPTKLNVELVEVGDRVALDVFRGARRTQRIFIPDLQPLGVPITLDIVPYPGEAYGEADLWWVNPNTGRTIYHFLLLGERTLESFQ
jgi:tRNA A-37 threonylcarbamoyl transferase component Bud32